MNGPSQSTSVVACCCRGLFTQHLTLRKSFLYNLVACSRQYQMMYAEVRRTPCNLQKFKMDYRWKIPQTELWSVMFWLLICSPRALGGGAVGGCAHFLVACHLVVYDMEKKKKNYRCHVNRMMFVWIPVSSRWRYWYDMTVLMHGGIQGNMVYMCDEIGEHGKLYVEVIRTWCFIAKHENGSHHDTHHVWQRRKLLITFHAQDLRMSEL